MDFYASIGDEAAAVRRAAARAGCRLERLSVTTAPRGAGRITGTLACDDGWSAAWLLLALAEEDARTPGARALSARIRAGRGDSDFARALHSFVKKRVLFAKEKGEIFQSGAFTLTNGVGDCDCHFRLMYALATAGGLPAKLAILHHGELAAFEDQGPAHATALLCPRDGDPCSWAETTVDARYGEPPNEAAARLGLAPDRTDIAKEVRIMSASELPPVPAGFRSRNDSAQVRRDAEALQRLGYLATDACGDFCDPTDPVLRRAVLAFQLARGLTPDALLGDRETRPALVAALAEAGPPVSQGFDYAGMSGIGEAAAVPARLSKHLSDEFFRLVKAMAARFRAGGATATDEDWLLVWLAESGFRNIPNRQGAPFGGLNQMGPDERKAAGFRGTFGEWLSLSPEAQLPFVERYYLNAAGGDFSRFRDGPSLYLANFAPARMAHAAEPDFVLFRRDAASPSPGAPEAEWAAWRAIHRGDPYAWNRGFDRRRDGTIRVGDLSVALTGAVASARPYWDEVRARLGSSSGSPAGIAVPVTLALLTAGAALAAWRFGWFA